MWRYKQEIARLVTLGCSATHVTHLHHIVQAVKYILPRLLRLDTALLLMLGRCLEPPQRVVATEMTREELACLRAVVALLHGREALRLGDVADLWGEEKIKPLLTPRSSNHSLGRIQTHQGRAANRGRVRPPHNQATTCQFSPRKEDRVWFQEPCMTSTQLCINQATADDRTSN